jgi:signal transduction histidine kinase
LAAAVGLVELARRAGVSLPDMTPLYLIAVVYAALDGGLWPGLLAAVVTFGHALLVAEGAAPGLYALAVASPAVVALATLLAAPGPDIHTLPPAVEAEDEANDGPADDPDTVAIERDPATLGFIAVSPNAERVLGLGADLAIANADFWTSGLHPGDRPHVQAAYDALKSAPAQCTLTYRVLSADAGFIRVRETLGLQRAAVGGRVLKLVGTITRLPEAGAPAVEGATPAAAAPAAPPAATPPEASDEVIARAAAGLEEPLDVLAGWARVLRADPDAGTRARAADMIERAVSAQARALAPLLRGAPPRPRLVHMALVIHAALEHTRPAAQARGIATAWSIDPDLELLYGDAARLEQIVRTMLGNAIDLAPEGARIHVAVEQAGALARLTVSDTAGEDGAGFFATLPVTAAERWRAA